MRKFLTILTYVKAYKKQAFLNVFFNLISVFFSLFSITMVAPFLNLLFLKSKDDYSQVILNGAPEFNISISSFIDSFNYYITKIIVEQGQMKALLFISLLVLCMIILKNASRYMGMYFMAPVRNGVVKDIRNKIYAKVVSLPLSFYSEERKGDIMSRMTNDVAEVEWAIMQSLEAVFREPIAVVFFLSSLFYMSYKLTLFVFVLLPLTALIIGKIGKNLKSKAAESKSKLGELMSIMEETLSGLRIIKGFNAEEKIKNRFFNLNNEYNSLLNKIYRRVDLSSPLSETLGVASLVLIMLFGGQLVIDDKSLSPSVFITYIAVFSQIIDPAKAFTNAYYNAQKGVASLERINKILDADLSILEPNTPLELKHLANKIEYKNVSFAYGEATVLNNFNLEIKKGTTVALVGQSGAGKSTIADLLPRFYDVSSGEICIDGINIKSVLTKDLRKQMGIVTQESILFNDTVFSNIAFGNDNVTMLQVEEAAKIANAHEFIVTMENGYQTNIGDRGSKLSGGQRQRLAIARAVLKNPSILILDEATSALDTESEKLVQDAIQKLMKGRTSLVIAHRLSTIQNADEIIVMQQGVILERGKHSELLAQNGQYKKLYDLQVFS